MDITHYHITEPNIHMMIIRSDYICFLHYFLTLSLNLFSHFLTALRNTAVFFFKYFNYIVKCCCRDMGVSHDQYHVTQAAEWRIFIIFFTSSSYPVQVIRLVQYL